MNRRGHLIYGLHLQQGLHLCPPLASDFIIQVHYSVCDAQLAYSTIKSKSFIKSQCLNHACWLCDENAISYTLFHPN